MNSITQNLKEYPFKDTIADAWAEEFANITVDDDEDDDLFIHGQEAIDKDSGLLVGQHTFSFEAPKKDETLIFVPSSSIQLLAKAPGYKCNNTECFQLTIFELPKNFAMDMESDDKCIDRGSTLRCINEAAVKGSGWRFQMVRTEFCTRITRSQYTFGEDSFDDEIMKQTIIGHLSSSIKGQFRLYLKIGLGFNRKRIKIYEFQ